jgi:hypothetical protein
MKLTLLLLTLTSCAALAATEEQTNKTFQVQPGGKLVVDVDFGSIGVTTNSTDAVAVSVWRKVTRGSAEEEQKYLSENPVVFVQDGNTVTVQAHSKTKEKFHWFGGLKNRNEAKYTIQVPAQFNARLNTSGGGIAASDVTGEVKADTSGGGLQFARLHGPLNGDTSGGSIHMTDCEGPIKIDTSGGGITIENVAGKIKGDTSGGSIHAVLLSPVPGDVSLETSGGGITVKVPADAAFKLDAEASGGGVHCDLPVTVQGKREHDELKGTVNGGGPVVHLETSGGGVHVEKL